jgi:hypothetical protein
MAEKTGYIKRNWRNHTSSASYKMQLDNENESSSGTFMRPFDKYCNVTGKLRKSHPTLGK